MLERILKQQQPICATLLEIKKKDLMPSDTEITAMETFVEVMEPIVKITEAMGGQKWVTVSSVKPLLHQLSFKYLNIVPTDSKLKQQIKEAVMDNLSTRYTNESISDLLDKACFLDPRFKSLSFRSDVDKAKITNLIENEIVAQLTKETQDTPDNLIEPPSKRHKNQDTLMSLLADVINPISTQDETATPSNHRDVATKEIQKYLCIDSTSECKPLEWWKTYQSQLPHIASLARKYLSIPSTSVPSERAFSCTGNIVNVKRSCLLPENVNKLTFLAHNLL